MDHSYISLNSSMRSSFVGAAFPSPFYVFDNLLTIFDFEFIGIIKYFFFVKIKVFGIEIVAEQDE